MTDDFHYDDSDLQARRGDTTEVDLPGRTLLMLLAALTIVCATIVAVVYLITQ